MNKTKTTASHHTPGPWKCDGPYGIGTAGDELHIANTRVDSRISSETAEADARLIARAPDMLEMLLEALPLVEEGEQFHKASCRTLSKRIRALLETNP